MGQKTCERILDHPTHSNCVNMKIVLATLSDEEPDETRIAEYRTEFSANSASKASEPYFALSYVWGYSKDDNPEILIDSTPVKVTPNLEKVLNYLENYIKLPIWIDAICINQNDNTEKREQVAQMRDIYAAATRIIVWLGEGDSTTERSMKHLHRIKKTAMDAGFANLSPVYSSACSSDSLAYRN